MFAARVLGPDRPAVARVKQMHIRKIMLKAETTLPIQQTRQSIRLCTAALMRDQRYKSLMIYYDVDPM